MSDVLMKSYAEWKMELSKTFFKVANHPEYVNKTYSGLDFHNAIRDWSESWINLVYHNNDIQDELSDVPNPYAYKLRKWMLWDHDFNCVLYDMIKDKEKCYFGCPDFLDSMFELTHRFLMATTREEEEKILNVSYCIEWTEKNEPVSKKYIWLSEDNLGIKNKELPCYAPYDLTNVPRGKKMTDYVKSTYKNSAYIKLNDVIREYKELWKCYKVAVKKGILIDNYDKKKKVI